MDKNTDQSFEDAVITAVKINILKGLSEGDWFKFNWQDKIVISPSTLREIYEAVDMDEVAKMVKSKIEARIVDACFNSLATEIATDVKKIMSNTELREDCRAIIRSKIREVAGGK